MKSRDCPSAACSSEPTRRSASRGDRRALRGRRPSSRASTRPPPLRTPEEAGEVLARVAGEHCFTLYEHFLTDRMGHEQNTEGALEVLRNLARFVRAALASVDLARTTVMLTSDHGNVEDLSTRNHTLNPVPTLAWGPGRYSVARRVRTLADITPVIVELLTSAEATA